MKMNNLDTNILDKEIQKELNNKDLILSKSSEELFDDLENIELIKQTIEKNFDKIYLIDVHPLDINKYKDNKHIYDILNHYVKNNAAENQNLQIMIFKLNKESLQKAQDIYEDNKEIFGDILKPFDYKYYYMVGYFGGTKGRTNQSVIKSIKNNFNVQEI